MVFLWFSYGSLPESLAHTGIGAFPAIPGHISGTFRGQHRFRDRRFLYQRPAWTLPPPGALIAHCRMRRLQKPFALPSHECFGTFLFRFPELICLRANPPAPGFNVATTNYILSRFIRVPLVQGNTQHPTFGTSHRNAHLSDINPFCVKSRVLFHALGTRQMAPSA